jgi:hypothetical protein
LVAHGKGNVTAKVEQKPINPAYMLKLEPASDPMFGNEDPQSNRIQIWRVEDFEKVPYPADLYGQFFSGDSFVILTSYKKSNKDAYLVYFWQGRDSSINEKGASALLTIDISTEVDNAPQIRITQQHETKHFLAMFSGRIIIHNGKYSDYNNRLSNNSPRMFDIRLCDESRDLNRNPKLRAIETYGIGKEQLNSNHVFAVISGDKKNVYIWKGKFSHPSEYTAATEFLVGSLFKTLAKPTVKTIEQGEEDDEFFKLLNISAVDRVGFKKQIKSMLEAQDHRLFRRLFMFNSSTGAVEVERIFNFCQDDLDNNNVMMLDVDTEIYLWIGTNSMYNAQKIAMETALAYANETQTGFTRPKNIEQRMFIVRPCEEPAQFTSNFQAWGPYNDRNMKAIAESATKKNGDAAKVANLELVTDRLKELSRVTYSYDELLMDPLPKGVDPTKLEIYLNDSEFKIVFEMTREEFNKLPQWKQEAKKKAVYLF